jgi:hypothetical protein
VLADDVPAQPDPAGAPQLEPEPACLLDRGGDTAAQAGRRQHCQQRPRPPGERREPAQPVTHPPTGHHRVRAIREIHHQQVHGPRGEQRTGQGEPFLQVPWSQDHQPLRADATGDRLHRVERTRKVHPGNDRAGSLRLGSDPQRERRAP